MPVLLNGHKIVEMYLGSTKISAAYLGTQLRFSATKPLPLDEFHYYSGNGGGSLEQFFPDNGSITDQVTALNAYGQHGMTQNEYTFTGPQWENTWQYVLLDNDYVKEVKYLDSTQWTVRDMSGHNPGLLRIQFTGQAPATGSFEVTTDGDSGPRVTKFTFIYTK